LDALGESRESTNGPPLLELVSKRAGLEGVRLHDLRHTHASFGAGAGLGLPIIGKPLGHTQSSTTQRYAHLDVDPLRRASEKIGNRLATAMGDLTTPSDHPCERKGSAEEVRTTLESGCAMSKERPGSGLDKVWFRQKADTLIRMFNDSL
jgi:hypothetical protein